MLGGLEMFTNLISLNLETLQGFQRTFSKMPGLTTAQLPDLNLKLKIITNGHSICLMFPNCSFSYAPDYVITCTLTKCDKINCVAH